MKDHNKKIFLKGILEYSSNLKLATFKDTVESEIRNATEIDSSYEELIYKLLQKECDYKQEQLRKNRIRTANFPYKRYLEELDVNELPTDAQNKLPILSTLDFIENGQNVILSGNCGTGKTHIAIGLGIKACLSGYKVFFATVPLFITQLKELRSTKSLRSFQSKLEKYDSLHTVDRLTGSSSPEVTSTCYDCNLYPIIYKLLYLLGYTHTGSFVKSCLFIACESLPAEF